MKKDSKHLIIVLFAVLHTIANILCTTFGLVDEFILTVLTICMLLLLCRNNNTRVDSSSWVIVFGSLGAYLIAYVLRTIGSGLTAHQDILNGPFICFVTTVTIGYFTILITRFLPQTEKKPDAGDWALIGISSVIVVIARVVLSSFFVRSNPRDMISDNLLYFLINFCAITTVLLILMVFIAWREKRKADRQEKEKNLAEFRYMKLNHQLNPHFLFNSLNVLDCLVSSGDSNKASSFIQKLSGLYRYMLDIGEKNLVHLETELDFVREYLDLMRERFPEGIETDICISQDCSKMEVVPCAVQLLVENAIKHNIASAEQPLHIIIKCDEGKISVSNNIQPKATIKSTTGKGLNYIKRHYADLTDAEVKVSNDGKEFKVCLPLISR